MDAPLLPLDLVPWIVAALLVVRLVYARVKMDQLSAQLSVANDRLAAALAARAQVTAADAQAEAALQHALQAMAARVAAQRAQNEEEVALR